jgi:cytochrome c
VIQITRRGLGEYRLEMTFVKMYKKSISIMTKFLFGLLCILSIAACGGNSGGDAAKQAVDLTANPDYQKGQALIAKNDCLTCHKIDEKLIGPTYHEVAAKYASAPDTIVPYLAHKVMKGGTGTWGQVAMAAHPNLSEEDATALVKYVLLFK